MGSMSFGLGRSPRLGAALAFAAFAVLTPASLAQTPVSEGGMAHPAHIHSGTCDELGDVVVPLADLMEPQGERSGPASAGAISYSHNFVDLPLQEIIDGGHAINVHLSNDEIGDYIACGDIGGVVMEGEEGQPELTIGLHALNDSGYVGIAWLGQDGDQTEVSVTLIEPDAMR